MRSASHLRSGARRVLVILLLSLLVSFATAQQGNDTSNNKGDDQTQKGDGSQSQQGDQKGGTKAKSDTSSSKQKDTTGKEQAGSSPDQAPIESEVLGFRGLRDDADKIFARIKSALPTPPADNEPSHRLVVYDAAQFRLIPTYRALNGQFGLIIRSYCGVLNQPAVTVTPPKGHGFSIPLTGVLTGAQAVNTTVAGILDTLKTTTELTSNNFTLSDDALVAEVANRFKSATDDTRHIQLLYPAVYPLDVIPPAGGEVPADLGAACDLGATAMATQRLYSLTFLRSAADSLLQALKKRIADLEKVIEEKNKQKPATDVEKGFNQQEIENAKAEKEQWQTLADKVTGLNKGADAFLSALTKADDSGSAALNNLFAAERLAAALAKPHAFTLALKIQKTGGQMLKKSNLFYGTRFYYGGGSIVSFFLFDAEGGIMSSGNFWSNTSYMREKSLKHISE
jgi:hypothetical protein